MKVVAIEVAEAIEKEIAKFLKEWGGGYPMRFTRFIDLGGKQTELYLYPPQAGASPWATVSVKSVFKSDQGDCMVYAVTIPSASKRMEDVLVSPEVWKLPALADKVLQFIKADLLVKAGEGGGAALEGGSPALESTATSSPQESSNSEEGEVEEDELEDLDTEGILASDDGGEDAGFDPMDIIAAANAEESDNPENLEASDSAVGNDADDEEDSDSDSEGAVKN